MLTHSGPGGNSLTVPERLAGAAVSCVAYLGQFFVPIGLSPYYCHPEAGWPTWQVVGATVLLLAITAAAVVGRRSYPYFFVGWFWYTGMLIPVLELIPVGGHARADRYTYLSQIGISIALVWGAMRLGASWPARRWVFGIGSAIVLAALMACTWRQTGFWHDDRSLWEHALACDPKNVRAHYILGTALEAKDESAAVAQYRQALEMGPDERNIYNAVRATAHVRLGNIAARKGDQAEAAAHYDQALNLDASTAAAHTNLAVLLAKQGDFDEALRHFQRSIEIAPATRRPIFQARSGVLRPRDDCRGDRQFPQGPRDQSQLMSRANPTRPAACRARRMRRSDRAFSPGDRNRPQCHRFLPADRSIASQTRKNERSRQV